MDFFDQIFDATIGLDAKGEITYFNHQAVIFFKISPRIFKQKKELDEVFQTDSFDLKEWITNSLLSREATLSPEIKITIADKSESFVILKLIPIKRDQETSYALIFQDKTLENKLHLKYRQQVEELRKTHEQILMANKLATLGELTASISHEISNPLTIASGHCEVLAEILSESSSEQNEFVNSTVATIQESLERVNQIIKDMKSFLHKKEDKKEYCNLGDVIRNAQRWINGQENEHPIAVHIKDDSKAIVLANESKLEQVFLNLLKNSHDALIDSQINDPHVDIWFEFKNQQTLIHLKDNGPGIAKSLHENLFKPFNTTKDIGKGTGLGLSISAMIIESHHGTIELLDSDKGCHFLITLPAVELYSYSLSNVFEINPKQKKILVLDDEVSILNLLTHFLEGTGHHIIGSSTPIEALNLIEKANVDIVITDYNMPQMNGSEFSKELRAKGFHGPIYYLSSSENSDKYLSDKDQFQIAGMILKPFSKNDILSIIQSTVKGLPE